MKLASGRIGVDATTSPSIANGFAINAPCRLDVPESNATVPSSSMRYELEVPTIFDIFIAFSLRSVTVGNDNP